MKVKILCKKDNYNKYKEMLERAGFEISMDADLTFREDTYIADYLIGISGEEYSMIPYKDILYVESFDHDIICHTLKEHFQIKERLYEVEERLYPHDFCRINKSQIVNKKAIARIEPTLNYRMILTLKNSERIYVTRNYYQTFKYFIGF